MLPILNNTKWDELRLAMYGLEMPPLWRTKDVASGYICPWDGEWFYRFRADGYETIEWVEIQIRSDEQRLAVEAILKAIHLPGERTDLGFKVYGYQKPGDALSYI